MSSAKSSENINTLWKGKKRIPQSALYCWRQRKLRGERPGRNPTKRIVIERNLRTTMPWMESEGATTKGQGQRPHGLGNEFNNDRGTRYKETVRGPHKETETKGDGKRQWWRCPALVMSLTFQGYFRQCSESALRLPVLGYRTGLAWTTRPRGGDPSFPTQAICRSYDDSSHRAAEGEI